MLLFGSNITNLSFFLILFYVRNQSDLMQIEFNPSSHYFLLRFEPRVVLRSPVCQRKAHMTGQQCQKENFLIGIVQIKWAIG